jgi:hypothetical protein
MFRQWFVFFLCICFTSFTYNSFSQSDSTKKAENAYVFRFLPSVKDNLYGIGFGLFGSEVICNVSNTRRSYGLNIQIIGQGLFVPLNRKAFSYDILFATDTSWMLRENTRYKAKHYGVLVSVFGSMTEVSNGIVISGLSSLGYFLNGLGFNLLSAKYTYVNGVSISLNNQSFQVKGLQIGLINKTQKLKGFQIGLWNCNEKRKLPFINWSFK